MSTVIWVVATSETRGKYMFAVQQDGSLKIVEGGRREPRGYYHGKFSHLFAGTAIDNWITTTVKAVNEDVEEQKAALAAIDKTLDPSQRSRAKEGFREAVRIKAAVAAVAGLFDADDELPSEELAAAHDQGKIGLVIIYNKHIYVLTRPKTGVYTGDVPQDLEEHILSQEGYIHFADNVNTALVKFREAWEVYRDLNEDLLHDDGGDGFFERTCEAVEQKAILRNVFYRLDE